MKELILPLCFDIHLCETIEAECYLCYRDEIPMKEWDEHRVECRAVKRHSERLEKMKRSEVARCPKCDQYLRVFTE